MNIPQENAEAIGTPASPYAFPRPHLASSHGMTLLDHFAGLCMQAFVTSTHAALLKGQPVGGSTTEMFQMHCEISYKIADLMLKERAK